MARKVASAIRAAGGTTYYVGGCVRDRLLGKVCKDIDIEVHDIYPSDLEKTLDSFRTRIAIGESFGIYNIKGYSLDIAMPRKEKTEAPDTRILIYASILLLVPSVQL